MKTIASLLCILALLGTGPLHAALPGGDALGGLITDEFDENADALVDRAEWEQGIGNSFGKLDSDHDGSIAAREVDGLQADIANQTGDAAAGLIVAIIKQLVLFLDKDKNQLVSREEYDALAVGIFDKLDADRSEKLARAELAAIPVKLIAP
jgi:hypothetical protein